MSTRKDERVKLSPFNRLEIRQSYEDDSRPFDMSSPTMHMFHTELVFGHSFSISDRVYRGRERGEAYRHMVENGMREVLHELYGWLREPLHLLRQSMEYGDLEEAKKQWDFIYSEISDIHKREEPQAET